MAQQNRAWEFDLEEGLLDPARLPRIIIDPLHALSFKQEKETNFRDTVVTVTFEPSADATVVEIHQIGLPDAEEQSGHRFGWSSALEKLEVLSAPPEPRSAP